MNIKKIISILLFCVSIGMIGTGVYLMNSNKYVYTTVITNSFNSFMKSDSPALLTEMGKSSQYQITTNTSLMLDDVNMMSLDGNIYIDNNAWYLNLMSKIVEEDFIDIEALMKDNKIYYKIKEAMDEFYYEELAVENNDEITKEDLNLIIEHLKDSIFKDLKDSDFTREKVTLDIDGLKFNTTKISLPFTEKVMYTSLVNFIEALSKDSDAIKVLQKISSDITKGSLETLLDELKQSSDLVGDELFFTLSVYTKSFNKPIRVEILISDASEIDSIAEGSVSLVFDSYDNANNYKTDSIKLMENNSVIIELREEYTSKNESNLSLEVNDITTGSKYLEIKGSKEITNTYINVALEALVDDTSIGNISYKVEMVTKGQEYKLEANATIDTEDGSLRLTSTNNIYLDKELPNVDVSNAKDVLTVEEQEALSNYINNKLEELGIYSDDNADDDFNYDDENYDYDYDFDYPVS